MNPISPLLVSLDEELIEIALGPISDVQENIRIAQGLLHPDASDIHGATSQMITTRRSPCQLIHFWRTISRGNNNSVWQGTGSCQIHSALPGWQEPVPRQTPPLHTAHYCCIGDLPTNSRKYCEDSLLPRGWEYSHQLFCGLSYNYIWRNPLFALFLRPSINCLEFILKPTFSLMSM